MDNKSEVTNKAPLSFTTEPAMLPDAQGNTRLHYAVAARDYPSIWRLVQSSEIDLMVKNKSGETAADWFLPYLNQLKISEDLDQLPQKIAQGDTAFIKELVEHNICWNVRYKGGDTPLHLAFKYEQCDIAKKIASTDHQLLNSKNGKGQTPLDLTPDKGKEFINNFNDNKSTAINASSGHHSTSTTFPPSIDQSQIAALAEQLKNNGDYAPLYPYLPTLCQLAYSTCQNALCFLNKIQTNNAEKNKLESAKELLKNLLGESYNKKRIECKIIEICNHLSTINYNLIEQYVTFSSDLIDVPGWSNSKEGKIYLNPTIEKTNLTTLIATLIHESSHLANKSQDLIYTDSYFLHDGEFTIDFNNCYQLAQEGTYNEEYLSKKKLVILATQEILERKIPTKIHLEAILDEKNRKFYIPILDNTHWLSYHNADTLMTVIIGLAAIHLGHYEIKPNHQLSINKAFPFSSELLAVSKENIDKSSHESSDKFDTNSRKIIQPRRKSITQLNHLIKNQKVNLNRQDSSSSMAPMHACTESYSSTVEKPHLQHNMATFPPPKPHIPSSIEAFSAMSISDPLYMPNHPTH